MPLIREIFCFSVDHLKFAIQLHQVDRVIQSVTVQKLPDSSKILSGVVDYHGAVLPVIDFRFRLGLNEKPLSVNDFFILAKTSKRKFIIMATKVWGMMEIPEQEIISFADLGSGLGMMGVTRRTDGIYYIYDLETFLTSEEEILLEKVIAPNQETQS